MDLNLFLVQPMWLRGLGGHLSGITIFFTLRLSYEKLQYWRRLEGQFTSKFFFRLVKSNHFSYNVFYCMLPIDFIIIDSVQNGYECNGKFYKSIVSCAMCMGIFLLFFFPQKFKSRIQLLRNRIFIGVEKKTKRQ